MAHRPINRLTPASGQMPPVNGKHPEDIADAMQRVRNDLSRDVENISQQVHDATQWTTYVKRYPWTCLAVAAAVGYSLVPRRKQEETVASPDTVEKLVKAGKLRIEATESPSNKPTFAQQAMLGLGTVAARALMAYFGKRLGDIIPTGDGPTNPAS
ncbi:hypothetical protein NG895_00445 [Aeoliella sp. ICT_H6.2]|uniref:DUF3618 domain-containing protein n=1 Tax=Aeoliella straminimaris TaxID=2954799 RepID=A0A9X2F617_9BACT|nr:hypothetical protein [Aeoliella straminimaris]MCO6042363.1 hypothetical protein [Aeoliella straminimaris]